MSERNQGIKQAEVLKSSRPEENEEVESIEGLIPKKMKSNEIKNEIDEIKKWEEKKKEEI